MKLALAKRRSKRLAAGTVGYEPLLKQWYLTLYGVTNGTAHPFGASAFDNSEAAIAEGNDVLQVSESDWVEIDEAHVAAYIESRATNKWDMT